VARLLFITIVIIALVPALGLWFVAQRALPVLDGVVTMNALSRLVTVKFDERAIPYIEASSDGDVYFVQGYVAAAQRMFQMDILRRTAEGQLAEIFGANSLPHDKLMRTIGINRLAEAEIKKLPKEVVSSLHSYTSGVNEYIEEHDGKLPLPFFLLGYKPKSWTDADSLAILKYHQYQSDESWQLDDLRQRILDKFGNGGLAPQLFGAEMKASVEVNRHAANILEDPRHRTGILEGSGNKSEVCSNNELKLLSAHGAGSALPIWGSNAWVVSGAASESKASLLACDKHGLFSSPDEWYLCSLQSPKLHVTGATIAGVPGVMIGRNAKVGWAATDIKIDGQDLVLEQFSPQFPNKYRVPSGWQPVSEVVEAISIRFASDLLHKVSITKDGPLLSRTEDSGVALSWASAEQKVSTFETLWRINRANNTQGFLNALQNYQGSPKSFVYADDQGNAGTHIAGMICLHGGQDGKSLPILGAEGTVIRQGWMQTINWSQFIPFNQLPGAQTHEPFSVADAPFTLSISSPYKWQRADALLTAATSNSQKVGLPDLALMQTDQQAPLSSIVKKELESSMKNASVIDGPKSRMLEMLRSWDGNVKADSVPASVYEAFLHATARRLLEPKLGQSMMLEYLEKWPRWSVFVEQVLINKPKEWLPPQERTYETFIVTSFSEALKNLQMASGSADSSKWSWQNCHRANFSDELMANAPFFKAILEPIIGIRTMGLGGDADSLDACNIVDSSVPWSYECNTGPTARILIDMADHDKLYANLVLGQTENPLSPYRTDQLQQWLHSEPHAVAFSSEQADRQLQHKLILTDR
jgi:penicillin amidase